MVVTDTGGAIRTMVIPMTVCNVVRLFIGTRLLALHACVNDPGASFIVVSSSCLPVDQWMEAKATTVGNVGAQRCETSIEQGSGVVQYESKPG